MGNWLTLADRIVMVEGIRSFLSRPRCFITWVPARQLWQPVSARARVERMVPSILRVWPWVE